MDEKTTPGQRVILGIFRDFDIVGTILAVGLSYMKWHSIGWAVVHGMIGWLYVIYYLMSYGIPQWIVLSAANQYPKNDWRFFHIRKNVWIAVVWLLKSHSWIIPTKPADQLSSLTAKIQKVFAKQNEPTGDQDNGRQKTRIRYQTSRGLSGMGSHS